MGTGDFGDQRDSSGQPGQPGWPGTAGSGQYDPAAQPGSSGGPGPGTPGQYGQYGQYGQPGWPTGGGPAYPYGQPGAPWQPVPQQTNSLAIAALCCAIAQVIAGPFSGIPAIVLGAMALKQIRLTGQEGRGMAMTGIVLGIIGVILTVIFIVIFVAFWHHMNAQFNNFNN